jgi:phosphohistidine phosphatase SixA
MKIFIARHGHAVSQAPADHLRPLSERGREEVARNALAKLDDLSEVQHIYTSPYVRARQTADIINTRLKKNISEVALITPEGDPKKAADYFYRVADTYDCILLTSHMPFVSRFTDALIGADAGTHLFNTSAIACVKCEPLAVSCCELKWLHHS